jgi:hypothetical protein
MQSTTTTPVSSHMIEIETFPGPQFMDNDSDDDRFISHSVPLPWKLHEMLDATEKDGLASVVSWLPDQRSFKVYQNEPFVRDIMPKWFRQSKYKSFQRQCKTTATCCRW